MVLKDATDLRGVWIWGDSGVGKSRSARDRYPNAFPKLCDEWWDGYQGEPNVIMDDYAPEHSKKLSFLLKIWGDRYGCTLRTKGGSVPSGYDKFVITSQYHPCDCDLRPKDLEAVLRRYEVRHLISYKIADDPEHGQTFIARHCDDCELCDKGKELMPKAQVEEEPIQT